MLVQNIQQAVETVVGQVGPVIRLAIPLGLGKPNAFVNALYARVKADPALRLEIYTALSLSKPRGGGELEQRFLGPFVERVYGDYEELQYLKDRRAGALPGNIAIHEFFFQPASQLANADAQQHYISSNYTHVARDLNARGVNVLAQMVAVQDGRYSLSCNPEVTLDLLPLMQQRKAQGEAIMLVGQVHHALPFMANDAEVAGSLFDALVDEPAANTALFSVPNMPVTLQDHCIGLHASMLVKDGGTLQIGIGSLGDAVAHHLLLRQNQSQAYQAIVQQLDLPANVRELVQQEGGIGPFSEGVYACSEMITEAMLALLQGGVIKRHVQPGNVLVHGGFFLGSNAFYQGLRDLTDVQRDAIHMTRISEVNHLYGDEDRKRQQRQHARFINTIFTATALGAGVSDQLDDGRVLSGVGGQYNFVSQAHELAGARSILLLRSWRERGSEAASNIVWQYAHATIPRHLRDIIVTEYGIADLRGRSDREVVEAMLSVTDARFQAGLVKQAQAAGKLPADYRVPDQFRRNTPARLDALRAASLGSFPEFPLGCDFDPLEQALLKALRWLKEKAQPRHFLELGRRVLEEADAQGFDDHLKRMGLAKPVNFKQKLERSLLLAALVATR
ncbi:MAG: acetyl-CoA hydrolase/transferase family protein [Gammaproteobacteria bacterium]|nr:MAG: acetyl-CoA hydrolase/transferase family protein [Gammaproteobacteria bacterium]